jgi:hypothetical protein
VHHPRGWRAHGKSEVPAQGVEIRRGRAALAKGGDCFGDGRDREPWLEPLKQRYRLSGPVA